MSRPTAQKAPRTIHSQINPAVMPQPLVLLEVCEGMNTVAAVESLPPTKAYDIVGMRIGKDRRLIAAELQSDPEPLVNNEIIVSMFYFVDAVGIDQVMAATTVGLQLRVLGGAWVKLSGPVFDNVNMTDFFSFAMWGQKILLTNQVVGLHEVDLALGVYAAIVDSNYPVAPAFVQVFGGRVIASRLVHRPGIVQWSAPGDSHGWDSSIPANLGAGEEDLSASTSAIAGSVFNLWPLSETAALLLRDRGISIVGLTDNFDAPFRFDRFVDGIGTKSPCSFVAIPGAQSIIGLSGSDIVIVNLSGVTPIGSDIINRLFDQLDGFKEIDCAMGAWHEALGEYWLLLPGHPVWGQTVLRYNVAQRAWVRYNFAHFTTSLCYYGGFKQLSYGETTGDYLSKAGGTIDDIGTGTKGWGMLGASSGGMTKIGLALAASTATTQAWKVETGEINAGRTEDDVTVSEVTVEYDMASANVGPVECEYSTDQGESWSFYSRFIPQVATADVVRRKHTATMTAAVAAHGLMFRLRGNTMAAAFRILKISVRVLASGRRFQQ